MQIYIKSCNDNKKWYADLIGQTVDLLNVEEDEYMSREPAGYINFVSKEDGVLVSEEI